jgi:hypothetical protein
VQDEAVEKVNKIERKPDLSKQCVMFEYLTQDCRKN